MDEARARLQTLGWFFYMLAGAVGLLAPWPLAYILLGTGWLTAPIEGSGQPPAETSSPMVVAAAILIVVGLAIGLGLAFAGRALVHHRSYGLCVAMSWIACLLIPVGTLLGAYALRELARPEIRAAFGPGPG